MLITEKCAITSYFASAYEISALIVVDLLRAIFYFIFAYDLRCGLRKIGLDCRNLPSFAINLEKQTLRCCCFFLVVITFAFAAPAAAATLGCLRDLDFINNCTDKNITSWAKEHLPYAHAVVKHFVFSSMSIICFYSVNIFYISKCKWEEATETMAIKEWTPGQGDLSKIVEENRYLLHNNYIEMGKKTSLERNILKRWFIVMFLVYFIITLIHLVHIMKILRDSNQDSDTNDIISAVLNTIIHFAMFLYPYYIGIDMNLAHQNYYKKMINTFQGVKIVLTIDSITYRYKCFLGNDIIGEHDGTRKTSHTEPINSEESSENTPLLQEVNTVKLRATEEYKKYYKETQRSFIMTRENEFDFIPSFLNISLPLDSDSYIIAAMLTIISILFNFLI